MNVFLKLVASYLPLENEGPTWFSGRAASPHAEPGDGTCQSAAAVILLLVAAAFPAVKELQNNGENSAEEPLLHAG